MNTLSRIEKQSRSWIFWLALLAAASLIVWLAPEEQTLGQGIKYVYVHVALIWAGMAGLVVAGLLGVVVLVRADKAASSWMETVGWVGLLFYALGAAMSIAASKATWGNVFWQEPRMRVTLNMLALVLIVEIVVSWVPWLRARGFLSSSLVVIIFWSTLTAPLVLHPRDPISGSGSQAIRYTFLSLFVLSVLAAVRVAFYIKPTLASEQ